MIPWRKPLQNAIEANSNYSITLATLKPYGKPGNREIEFSGFVTRMTPRIPSPKLELQDPTTLVDEFLNELVSSDGCHYLEASFTPIVDPLESCLIFVVDVRSGIVRDFLHGSKYGEICWTFPETKETVRLSGRLHLVVSPEHPLKVSGSIESPFNMDWEEKRKSLWESTNQQLYHLPPPGHLYDPTCPETSGYDNFALLVLEVDRVDFRQEKTRIKYTQTKDEWVIKHVNP